MAVGNPQQSPSLFHKSHGDVALVDEDARVDRPAFFERADERSRRSVDIGTRRARTSGRRDAHGVGGTVLAVDAIGGLRIGQARLRMDRRGRVVHDIGAVRSGPHRGCPLRPRHGPVGELWEGVAQVVTGEVRLLGELDLWDVGGRRRTSSPWSMWRRGRARREVLRANGSAKSPLKIGEPSRSALTTSSCTPLALEGWRAWGPSVAARPGGTYGSPGRAFGWMETLNCWCAVPRSARCGRARSHQDPEEGCQEETPADTTAMVCAPLGHRSSVGRWTRHLRVFRYSPRWRCGRVAEVTPRCATLSFNGTGDCAPRRGCEASWSGRS